MTRNYKKLQYLRVLTGFLSAFCFCFFFARFSTRAYFFPFSSKIYRPNRIDLANSVSKSWLSWIASTATSSGRPTVTAFKFQCDWQCCKKRPEIWFCILQQFIHCTSGCRRFCFCRNSWQPQCPFVSGRRVYFFGDKGTGGQEAT